MKFIRLVGHLHFAIMLVGFAALFAISGTILEALTESHLYAAQLTYSTWPFYLLLSGFFFNILISALLRWPFKKRHIPFLLTHLGLLMMILGTAIKSWSGIQGTMAIMEGSVSNQVLLSGTSTLSVTPREGSPINIPASFSRWKKIKPSIEARVMQTASDSSISWASWIKQGNASVRGLPPIPLIPFEETLGPPTAHVSISSERDPWAFYAISTNDVDAAQKELSKRHFKFKGSNEPHSFKAPPLFTLSPCVALVPDSYPECYPCLAVIQEKESATTHLFAIDEIGNTYHETFPENDLQSVVVYDEGFGGYATQAVLPFSSSLIDMETHKAATLFALSNELRNGDLLAEPLEKIRKACEKSGEDFPNTMARLLDEWHTSKGWLYPTDRPVSPELARTLVELETNLSSEILWASIILTELEERTLNGSDLIESLTLLKWPLTKQLQDLRKEKGKVKTEELPFLMQQLTNQIFLASNQLPSPPKPPESLNTTEKLHFLSVELRAFGISLGSLAGSSEPDQKTIQTLQIASELKERCCKALGLEFDAPDRLVISSIKSLDSTNPKITEIENALLSLQSQLSIDLSPQRLFAGIQQWLPPKTLVNQNYKKSNLPELTIETPLVRVVKSKTATSKIEQRIPVLAVEVRQDNKSEKHFIPFDKTAQSLSWPALQGSLLLAYQPKIHTLPFQVRLRDARQITYENATQVKSYEADLIFKDSKGKETEASLSMNHVYESPEGYRFYLSALTPDSERQVQRVQLVVNYDPVKRWLTYPGAILVAMGILGLFGPPLIQRKRKTESDQ